MWTLVDACSELKAQSQSGHILNGKGHVNHNKGQGKGGKSYFYYLKLLETDPPNSKCARFLSHEENKCIKINLNPR